jgi:Cu2+-exporting ATPase
MVGTGLAAKRGVLFKNATALETSARIDTVVLDKTGTLTLGAPEVTELIAASGDAPDAEDDDGAAARVGERQALALAAAVEQESERPLARAIVAYAASQGLRPGLALAFRNVPGRGGRGRRRRPACPGRDPHLVGGQRRRSGRPGPAPR